MAAYIVLSSPSPGFLPVGTRFEWDGITLVAGSIAVAHRGTTYFLRPQWVAPAPVPTSGVQKAVTTQVPTSPKTDRATNERHICTAIWHVSRLARNKHQWAERLKWLREAIETSYKEMAEMASCAKNPLFVFAAPEYYLAKSNKEHFIEESQKELVRETLRSMSSELKGLLIVPGTIAWVKTAVRPDSVILKRGTTTPKTGGAKRDLTKYSGRYDELSKLIQDRIEDPSLPASALDYYENLKNERTDTEQGHKGMIAKNDPNLRIARNAAFAFYNGEVYVHHKTFESVMGDFDINAEDKPKETIFLAGSCKRTLPPIDGVQIGIEVCSDHAYAALLMSNRQQAKKYHLQIVVSDYVDIHPHHTVIPEKTGYLVHASTKQSGLMQFPEKTEFADPTVIDPERVVKASPGELWLNAFTILI